MRGYAIEMERLLANGEAMWVEDDKEDSGGHYELTEKGKLAEAKEIEEIRRRREAKLKELEEQGVELLDLEPIDLDEENETEIVY